MAIVLWSAFVLALAAVPLAGAYDSSWVVLVLAAAALVPFGLVSLGARLGVGRWAVAVAGVALGVAGLMVILRPVVDAHPLPSWRAGAPALDPLAPLIDAVPRLLTAPRPAPPAPDLLAPAVLLVWLAALAVALVVVPALTARAAPLIGAAVIYVVGALLTAGEGDRSGVVALAVVVVIVAGWIALPGRSAPAETTHRRALLLPTAGAVVAASFALVAASLPTTGSFEPRVHVPPPQLPATASNPVPEVSAWNLDGDRPLFVVAPRSQPLPERMALATLADFDGAAWTLDARLRAIGVVDEPLLPAGQRRASTDLVIRVDQLSGAWLPSSGVTTASSGAAPVADVDAGSLVLPDGVAAGLAVTLTGSHDAPTEAEVERAGVPPATEAARFLELPRAPQELRDEAAEITDGATSRLEQALAIEDAVRGGRVNDLAAQSGSSYGRLMEFLFLPEGEAGQVGTAEQFAGAFAVLGRSVGLPTRLVVGFDIEAAVEDGATAALADPAAGAAPADGGEGTGVVVRGRHATIWPEVYFANAGWVAFQPTPDESTTTPPAAAETEVEQETEESTAQSTSEPREQTDAPRPADSSWTEELSFGTAIVAVGGILATLLVVLVLGALAVRLVRRRRWRAAGARGAWAHVLDAFVLHGRTPRPGETPPSLVAELEPEVREPALALAGRAEAEAFGPRAAVDREARGGRESAEHWQEAQLVARSLRARLPWWRRAWWWVSLRVLRTERRR
ncbi:transglutaminase domain-containing protein [Georgenia sp. MJ173]|uniref:DUF3488 and transglutaminase-like domain-containing protein n=1 Tax=Georgenia sunbinii TaxID=3117728 RepID=UPI002F25F925